MHSFFITFTSFLVSTAYAAIGPTASIFVENNDVSPDGLTRSYVFILRSITYMFLMGVHLAPCWQVQHPERRRSQVLSLPAIW